MFVLHSLLKKEKRKEVTLTDTMAFEASYARSKSKFKLTSICINLSGFHMKTLLITIMFLLLLYIYMNAHIRILRTPLVPHNIISKFINSSNTFNDTQSVSLHSIITSYIHQQSDCNIEIYGGFYGVEQAYISGTLFRDIMQTCSCVTHYQKPEKFIFDMREAEALASHQSHRTSRVVWCVGLCPNDTINWCKNETHYDYCQKHVVLIDLSDEALSQPIDHYPYFAAVYRNYLRHETGNHLSYLTQHIRKLPRTGDTLRIHRLLNWSLAIDIMREEWKAAGIQVDNVTATPTSDVAARLNNRITTRLLLNNEGITYHTWPDLDAKSRNHTRKRVPVFWFPMGYTNAYLFDAGQSSVGRLSKRQKLWSWSGSMKSDERPAMVNVFNSNDTLTEYIKQHGSLTVTGGFAQGVQFMEYTSQLLDSQFIPLPRGGSPEQFRSYEASDAGAILIVNEQWLEIDISMKLAPLAYLNVLGYDPVTISNFRYLPQKLLELSRLPPELLDDWQSIMLSRHRIVMSTLSKHIASVLCAANTPYGYIFKK
jgi:hypothetical protein